MLKQSGRLGMWHICRSPPRNRTRFRGRSRTRPSHSTTSASALSSGGLGLPPLRYSDVCGLHRIEVFTSSVDQDLRPRQETIKPPLNP
jgi:hypothetical protein